LVYSTLTVARRVLCAVGCVLRRYTYCMNLSSGKASMRPDISRVRTVLMVTGTAGSPRTGRNPVYQMRLAPAAATPVQTTRMTYMPLQPTHSVPHVTLFASDIAVFVLKRNAKLQPTNQPTTLLYFSNEGKPTVRLSHPKNILRLFCFDES